MKTTFLTLRKHHYKWRRLKEFIGAGLRDWPSLFSSSEHLQSLTFLVQKSKSSQNMTALVNKVAASLVTLKSLSKTWLLNDRIFLAFIIFGAAPFVACIHMLFNREVVVPELAEYHENYFHLFNLLGPYLFCIVCLFGACLLIPRREKTFKVFKKPMTFVVSRIMALPIGFCVSKITWLYHTKSNEDFWAIPNWSYCVAGLAVGYLFYITIEWLTWRKYHAFDGLLATIEGLYKIELPEEIRREKVLPLIKELKEFNLKY